LAVPINFFLDGTGKRGVQASDYLEQVLEPVVAPAFQGLLGYEGYRAKQEEDEKWGLYVEDHAPVHGTKKAQVEAKRALEIPLHERPSSSPDPNPIENVWRILSNNGLCSPLPVRNKASCRRRVG
jgi:hypothetical protein